MLNNLSFRRFIVPIAFLCVFVVSNFAINRVFSAEAPDYLKMPPDTYHIPFAPAENPIYIPPQKPKAVTIKVKEVTTYEVAVDESKLKPNTLTMADIELIEVHDKNKINFHQVDCYFYAKVKQSQTRTTDYITSMRWREGQQYWLSDGGKYVEWEPWSEWYEGNTKW